MHRLKTDPRHLLRRVAQFLGVAEMLLGIAIFFLIIILPGPDPEGWGPLVKGFLGSVFLVVALFGFAAMLVATKSNLIPLALILGIFPLVGLFLVMFGYI